MDGARQKTFTPELLGRLDRVIHFEPLQDDAMEIIVGKFLALLQKRTGTQGIRLELPPDLASHLGSMERGKGGARNLRRIVQEQVEGPLATFLLECSRKPECVNLRLEEGKIRFENE